MPLSTSSDTKSILFAWFKNIFAIAGHDSYNTTWWFNALIIELYLMFPLLYYGIKHACIPTLFVCYLLRHVSINHISIDMGFYIFIFVIGVAMATYSGKLNKIGRLLPKWSLWGIAICCVALPCYVLPAIDDGNIYYKGIKLYMLLTIGLVILIKLLFVQCKYISIILSFLGKHSANVYLMHTLIFYYWFHAFFYSIKYPFLIFISLMCVCVVISIVVEYIKEWTCYNKLFRLVLSKI